MVGVGNLGVRGSGVRGGRGGVWNDIIKVGEELERLGLEFGLSFVGEVGNEGDIRFWVDRWVGGVRLCDRFPRLYHLEGGDRWRWELHESGEFTVKELTKMVEEKILEVNNGGGAMIWNK
ncbi:hypothetical protein Tco_1043382 [Tanacetum coccineum]|uniref:Uncharacterized protein n=1 Tax=Tanacetum coccineum TaxID=301880 RepID=A0ABQ5GP26_9ASTR